jgi:hypothetical protein
MSDDAEKRDDQQPMVHVDLPGVDLKLSEKAFKTLMQHTGDAWNWVIYAFALSIVLYALANLWSVIR